MHVLFGAQAERQEDRQRLIKTGTDTDRQTADNKQTDRQTQTGCQADWKKGEEERGGGGVGGGGSRVKEKEESNQRDLHSFKEQRPNGLVFKHAVRTVATAVPHINI